jgi:hypothetical protein
MQWCFGIISIDKLRRSHIHSSSNLARRLYIWPECKRKIDLAQCAVDCLENRESLGDARRNGLIGCRREMDFPAGRRFVLEGTSNNCHRLSGASNLPANDSALFSFRFCAVHPKDVSDCQLWQFFEVPLR